MHTPTTNTHSQPNPRDITHDKLGNAFPHAHRTHATRARESCTRTHTISGRCGPNRQEQCVTQCFFLLQQPQPYVALLFAASPVFRPCTDAHQNTAHVGCTAGQACKPSTPGKTNTHVTMSLATPSQAKEKGRGMQQQFSSPSSVCDMTLASPTQSQVKAAALQQLAHTPHVTRPTCCSKKEKGMCPHSGTKSPCAGMPPQTPSKYKCGHAATYQPGAAQPCAPCTRLGEN